MVVNYAHIHPMNNILTQMKAFCPEVSEEFWWQQGRRGRGVKNITLLCGVYQIKNTSKWEVAVSHIWKYINCTIHHYQALNHITIWILRKFWFWRTKENVDDYSPFESYENRENKWLKFRIILNFRKKCRFQFY